jgi:multidrug resistance efflux pump
MSVQTLTGRARRNLSLSVWAVGAVFATGWGLARTQSIEAPAVGYALAQDVSSLETARILEVAVQLHDHVESGALVARLDTEPLVRERDVVAADLLAAQAQLQTDAALDARRFAEGSEQARLEEARLRVALQEDRALRDGHDARLAQLRALVDQGAGSIWEVQDLERERAVVAGRVLEEEKALEVAALAAASAEARNAERPPTNEWELVANERRLQQLESRIGQLNLSSRVAGQVVAVYRGPGDVIAAGEPVVRVVPEAASEALAYLPPDTIRRVQPGAIARVVRPTGEVVKASVRSVGASPEQLPAQLWRNSAAPEWGVPVLMDLEGAVAPGEPLKVRL